MVEGRVRITVVFVLCYKSGMNNQAPREPKDLVRVPKLWVLKVRQVFQDLILDVVR